MRLDQALAATSTLSRRRARALIGEGVVSRNGRPTRNQSRPVATGDVLEIPSEAGGPAEGFEGGAPPVAIVHEDATLLALDKPYGVLSQPAEKRQPGALAMDERALLALAERDGHRPFPRLVHRIDRVTSGLLLFARAPEALPRLAAAWREGRVGRRYLAVVEGLPEPSRQTVEAPIDRAGDGGWRFTVSPSGRPAATEVEVLDSAGELALVECRLLTGRTHQVRVHLAHLGHPVTGDRLYGARQNPAGRPLLHAAGLRLPHPETGETLLLESAPPQAFAAALAAQRS